MLILTDRKPQPSIVVGENMDLGKLSAFCNGEISAEEIDSTTYELAFDHKVTLIGEVLYWEDQPEAHQKIYYLENGKTAQVTLNQYGYYKEIYIDNPCGLNDVVFTKGGGAFSD